MSKNLRMLLCIMMLMIGISVSAQVTTSSISGIVLDENEAPLIGATVEAKTSLRELFMVL